MARLIPKPTAEQVLELIAGHRELSTHTICRELEIIEGNKEAYKILKPLRAAGLLLSDLRGGHLYWRIPGSQPTRARRERPAIKVSDHPEILNQQPTRGRLIDWNNDNDAPTDRRAQKNKTLEGLTPDYKTRISISRQEPISEVTAQIAELSNLGLLDDVSKVTRELCIDAGAILRVDGKYHNYDWLVDVPPAMWTVAIVFVRGSKNPPFLSICRFF